MKPPRFDYVAAASLDEALEALADTSVETRPLAGGQSLVPLLNFRLAAPERLVDLNGIAELARVEEMEDGGLRLGAMTRHRQLELDPLIAQRIPLLAEAARFIAHPPDPLAWHGWRLRGARRSGRGTAGRAPHAWGPGPHRPPVARW